MSERSGDPAAPSVWCLVGPTATGKTALAAALAQETPLEIISADSRMVYRGMDIGTAKPDAEILRRAPHHVIDVVNPDEQWSVVDWVAHARRAMEQIWMRGRRVLIVGGTGLYVRALCDGLAIPPVAPDFALRAELEARAARDGWQALTDELRVLDPVSANRIEGRNVRRVIRAIEVTRITGRAFSEWQERRPPPFGVQTVGLDLARTVLDARIDARVVSQIAAGLDEEVRGLLRCGYDRSLPPLRGLGYKEMIDWIDGETTRGEATRRYQAVTRQYARRQQSWFRPDPRIHWFDAEGTTPDEILAQFTHGGR